MKIKLRLSALLIASFVTVLSYSQPSYREGYVVDNNGDTIKGWIDYRQWDDNPKTIRFKVDLKIDKAVTYSINDLSRFEVTGLDKYIRAVVNKDMRPVAINLLEYAVDTTVSDTVFLRTLMEGTINLYQLEDSKSHFYIKETGKEYQELLYKLYLKDGKMTKKYIFRDQLRQFFPNSYDLNALPAILKTAEYKETDLIRLVEKVNASIPGGKTVYKVKKVRQPVSLYAGAGIMNSGLSYSGSRDNTANLDYSKSSKPLLVAGADFHIGRNHQRLFLRVELAWYSLQYKGVNRPNTSDSITYKIKINNLTPSLSILYNVINYPKSKLYLGGGVSYNLSSYPENELRRRYAGTTNVLHVSPYLDFEKSWISTHVKAGYLFINKIEIAGAVKLRGSFSNFAGISLNPSQYLLNLNYHLF